jgi:hypothetical protein
MAALPGSDAQFESRRFDREIIVLCGIVTLTGSGGRRGVRRD